MKVPATGKETPAPAFRKDRAPDCATATPPRKTGEGSEVD